MARRSREETKVGKFFFVVPGPLLIFAVDYIDWKWVKSRSILTGMYFGTNQWLLLLVWSDASGMANADYYEKLKLWTLNG